MNLDNPEFAVSQIAEACDVSGNTLRSWMQSGAVLLGETDRSAPPGGVRKLSLRRALQIAIMKALVEMGVAPKRAASLAAGFTDVGDGPGPDNGNTRREPGHLFEGGYTFLVAHPGEDTSRIVRTEPQDPAVNLLWRQGARGPQPAIVVPLDNIVRETIRALVTKGVP